MAGLGILMILTALIGLALRRHGQIFEARWFQRLTVAMGPAGFISLLAGWITTEAGRQPWVVYGVMRTADAVSPVTQQSVGVSLLIFIMVYCLVFGTGIYYILKLIGMGPTGENVLAQTRSLEHDADATGRRPLAAVK